MAHSNATYNPNKMGLSFGLLIGGIHLLWSLCVYIGFAQTLVDAVLRMHMITPFISVTPFSLTNSIGLVLMTFVCGYVVAWVFTWLWNMIVKK